MKRASRLLITSLFCFFALAAGVPAAYAGCMDDAGDAILGVLSGGTSVAACELQELVDAIKGFVQLVSDLATNVANNAKQVADAAIGAVSSAADDVANAVGNAQRTLASAASEATSLAAPQVMAVAPIPNVAGTAAATSAANRQTAAATGASRAAVAPVGAAHATGKAGVGPQAMAPITLPADPQQLQAALQRGAQELNTLQSSVEGDIARRVNDAVQRARNQATSHLSAADEIVRTALLAPINGLLNMLNDLASHPQRLLDPVATINTMVLDITRNVVDTMNHINDVITQDAVNTLRGVEADVQQAQSAADKGGKLLEAMRRARQQKSDAALRALEAQLNAAAPQQGGGGFGRARAPASPAVAAFRFDNVHSRMRATLQRSIAPNQALANSLKTRWAAIQTKQQVVKPHPLDPRARQTAQAELDRMFRGKSPAEVERAKQDLLGKARQKFGSDPKLMASLEQNLNEHVRTHYTVAAPSALPQRTSQTPNAARGPQQAAPGAAGAQMR